MRNAPSSSTRKQVPLPFRREVADLVQEKGAAVGQLEAARLVGNRAGERPFDVAEQLGLEQLFGQRRAVHRDERPVAPGALRVDRAGGDLLAGAALAFDQHRHVAVGHLLDEPRHGAHGFGIAHQQARVRARLQPQPQLVVLGHHRLELQGFLHQRPQPLHVNRLGQVIVSALLHRLDGALDRPEGGHQDEQRVAAVRPDLRQQFQAAEAGHLDVRDHQVVEPLLSQFQCRRRIGHRINDIALAPQGLLHPRAQPLLVIHHQVFCADLCLSGVHLWFSSASASSALPRRQARFAPRGCRRAP